MIFNMAGAKQKYVKTLRTEIFARRGRWEWTCPKSVSEIEVRIFGGGGGGNSYGGGGGGHMTHTTAFVTPGEIYIVTIGAGGVPGGAGDASVFDIPEYGQITANGGTAPDAKNHIAGCGGSGGGGVDVYYIDRVYYPIDGGSGSYGGGGGGSGAGGSGGAYGGGGGGGALMRCTYNEEIYGSRGGSGNHGDGGGCDANGMVTGAREGANTMESGLEFVGEGSPGADASKEVTYSEPKQEDGTQFTCTYTFNAGGGGGGYGGCGGNGAVVTGNENITDKPNEIAYGGAGGGGGGYGANGGDGTCGANLSSDPCRGGGGGGYGGCGGSNGGGGGGYGDHGKGGDFGENGGIAAGGGAGETSGGDGVCVIKYYILEAPV